LPARTSSPLLRVGHRVGCHHLDAQRPDRPRRSIFTVPTPQVTNVAVSQQDGIKLYTVSYALLVR
jgi:hypothetical protein